MHKSGSPFSISIHTRCDKVSDDGFCFKADDDFLVFKLDH